MGDRLQRAVRWATKKHFGQWREGETPLPYIQHPIDVLTRLRYTGGVTDEASLCAAALHDLLEQTDATYEEVLEKFGEDVAGLVKELTRREPTEDERQGLDADGVWHLRSEMLIAEIAEMSHRAMAVKLADRLSNIEEARRTKAGPKMERYLAQTRRILQAVPREVNPGLWDDLAARV